MGGVELRGMEEEMRRLTLENSTLKLSFHQQS
jgi:hypothetical protein